MFRLKGTFIGGLGELVWFIRPPVTGRSASFRLRSRFVRAVRAVRAVRGEAKLCGCMWDAVLIAGPPGCWDPRVVLSVSGAFGVNILCAGAWVLTEFASLSNPRAPFVDAF